MRPLSLAWPVLLVSVFAGCTNTVSVADSLAIGGGGSTTVGSTTVGSTTGGAIDPVGTTTGTGTSPSDSASHNRAFTYSATVFPWVISNRPEQCQWGAPGCQSNAIWEASFTAQLKDLAVGSVIPVADAYGSMTLNGPLGSNGSDSCTGAFENLVSGTIEVLAIDDLAITLHITGIHSDSPLAPATDDTYVVPYCDVAEAQELKPTHALVTTSAKDPQSLTIHIGSQPPTCDDPNLTAPMLGHLAVVNIELPASMQSVGTYPLTDLGHVGVVYSSGEISTGDSAVYDAGFIQVESIDDGAITFTLSGTDPFFLPSQNLDGQYTAARCP